MLFRKFEHDLRLRNAGAARRLDKLTSIEGIDLPLLTYLENGLSRWLRDPSAFWTLSPFQLPKVGNPQAAITVLYVQAVRLDL